VLLPVGEAAVAQTSLPISPSAEVEFTATHTHEDCIFDAKLTVFSF
jgi:hypothetical protein